MAAWLLWLRQHPGELWRRYLALLPREEDMCCLLNYQVGLHAGLSEVHGRGRTVGGACMGGRKGTACGCVGSCTWPRRQLHEMPRLHARRRAHLLACMHAWPCQDEGEVEELQLPELKAEAGVQARW